MRLAYLYGLALLGLTVFACQTGPLYDPSSGEGLTEELVEIKTRPGVTQNFILIRPQQPLASVIMFAGGHGNLDLYSARSMKWGKSNFLVRTRTLFANQRLVVVVLDAPSDRKSKSGMHGFRSSPEHVTDIEAVIAFLRNRFPAPVWLIGTSRGTISAAHIANHSNVPIDGLVLTSSMHQLTTSSLSHIRIPALVVAHTYDKCKATPPGAAEIIANRMSNAPKTEVMYFKGGWIPASGPCNALSQHGFYGLEKKVVEAIAGFIKTMRRSGKP